jgi:dCMP deaminase
MSMDSLIYMMSAKERDMELKEHISWNQYFMGLAVLASKRSKDPSKGVGAVIIDPNDHRVISIGYNGFPYGCSDLAFPWSKGVEDSYEDTKYAYVVHAEQNAILSAKRDLSGMVLYVTYSPCNECMKSIIQSGIKTVVYMNEYNAGSCTDIAARRMAKAAGVKLVEYKSENTEVNLGVL